MSVTLWIEKEHGGHAGNLAPELDLRPASVEDIIEVLKAEGYDVVNTRLDPFHEARKPGVYLVIPLDQPEQT